MDYESHHVAVIGSGNWATVIAKQIARNCIMLRGFDDYVSMYVYDETFEGKKLADIINNTHENPKYMPNFRLPNNIIAYSNIDESARKADILVLAIPSFFVSNCCKALLGKVKTTAIAVSLVKGFETSKDGNIVLLSRIISRHLKIPCAVLVGCNLPHEIAYNNFCEATLGCRDKKYHKCLVDIFRTENFRVDIAEDVECVEIISVLKSIVGFAAGMANGMNMNENTKAGIIRRGFLEILQFVDIFFPGSQFITFFQSCSISDLVTVCYANRNRKLGEIFVKTMKPVQDVQDLYTPSKEPLGPYTASVVYEMLLKRGLTEKFPFFSKIHKICIEEEHFETLTEALRFAREDIYHPHTLIPL